MGRCCQGLPAFKGDAAGTDVLGEGSVVTPREAVHPCRRWCDQGLSTSSLILFMDGSIVAAPSHLDLIADLIVYDEGGENADEAQDAWFEESGAIRGFVSHSLERPHATLAVQVWFCPSKEQVRALEELVEALLAQGRVLTIMADFMPFEGMDHHQGADEAKSINDLPFFRKLAGIEPCGHGE